MRNWRRYHPKVDDPDTTIISMTTMETDTDLKICASDLEICARLQALQIPCEDLKLIDDKSGCMEITSEIKRAQQGEWVVHHFDHLKSTWPKDKHLVEDAKSCEQWKALLMPAYHDFLKLNSSGDFQLTTGTDNMLSSTCFVIVDRTSPWHSQGLLPFEVRYFGANYHYPSPRCPEEIESKSQVDRAFDRLIEIVIWQEMCRDEHFKTPEAKDMFMKMCHEFRCVAW